MAKEVVIIGAGPAGLFAAYKLAGKAHVTILDKGRDIEKRICVNEKKCQKCNPCNIDFGIGGAGLFSDGKLNFDDRVGCNLKEVVGSKKSTRLIAEVEEILFSYGVKARNLDKRKCLELETKALNRGIKYLPIKQAHVGSDLLPNIITKIRDDLRRKNVRFSSMTSVDKIEKNYVLANNKKIKYDSLLMAPGRVGAEFLEKVVKEKGMDFKYNPVDIGVRVEVPSSVMEEICKINWDPKVYIRTPTYDDSIRTFCVSPYGYVAKENYGSYCLVNGHSRKNIKSSNTNFAFLIKVKLTKPLESTNLYGKAIAEQATTIGGGKPILQRLGDLRKGRRSNWERINKSYVKPTLTNVTPGDIAMAMPYRFVKDILEGLAILNKLIPGVADNSTLLYGVEVKFHGLRILTDKTLRTNVKNIYVAGDGAGLSRGIVGAAASGLLAAEGILHNIK